MMMCNFTSFKRGPKVYTAFENEVTRVENLSSWLVNLVHLLANKFAQSSCIQLMVKEILTG